MLIEFHGDNKLLSEFVIMGDRSNNKCGFKRYIVKLTFKVKGRKIWLSNGLCDDLKVCKQCVHICAHEQ